MLANSSGSQVTVGATSVTKGNSTTLTLPWSTLCALLAAPGTSSDCETSDGATDLNKGLQFKIGISAANDSSLNEADDDSIAISVQVQRSMADTVDTTAGAGSSTNGSNGIFDFSVFPGDAKVYLENLAAHANFPVSANGVIYTKVHLLSVPNVTVCTPGLFGNSFVTDSSKTKSVSLDGSELTDDRFFGYENEVSYLFKVALEDRAGNIGQFTDDADCVTAKHVAKPGQVFGLLREQQNCFIATATFGSPLDPTVGTFRSFRDRFLAPSKWGQSLIQFYYTHSPQPAATIRENETLRSISRAALMPFWIFAVISLNYGFMAAVLVFSVLTIAALLAFRALQRHLQKRIGT